jgi:predicted aspartyl protease
MMGTQTMGRVVVKARMENLEDLILVRAGHMDLEEVRTLEVDDALVDTEAAMLCLTKKMIKKLGLKEFTSRQMRTAKGSVMTHIFEAVRLTIQGRDCTIDVCQVAEGCPVLVGQVPLELLDFVVDPKRQRLIGNPEHGGKFMYDMF